MALTSQLANWVSRLVLALGPPSLPVAIRRDSDWDYDQADSHIWVGEPDGERLWEALTLRRTDPIGALSLFFILADENSAGAVNAIGENYYWGTVGPIDRAIGEAWFRRAFELGSQRGLLNLGKALFWRADLDGAEAVFQVGADAGWAPAFYWLAQIQLRRPQRRNRMSAVRLLLQRALDGGSPAARVQLGSFMTAGRYGLKNIRRGLRLMREDAQSISDLPLTEQSG
jgi:TPR repeat protein